IGNRNLHALTANQPHELKIDYKDIGETRFAQYSSFYVGPEMNSRFYITANSVSGDSMANHNGMQFSTKDQDHDPWSRVNCAHKGGWWYNHCHHANLNGLYLNGAYTSNYDGMDWNQWKGHFYSIQFTKMKIRPIIQFRQNS
ncbi:hypothetical protein CAPTEDRAFT_101530, partial [Capitella teleta]